MAKIEPPIYMHEDPDDDDVIVFGKGKALVDQDNESGRARFGGEWRSPNYLRAYRRAAKRLLSSAQAEGQLDEMALPIFFLQRHTIELLLKTFLRWCYEIAELGQQVAQPGQDGPTQPSQGMKKRLSRSHDLTKLLRDLKRQMPAIGHGEPPAEFDDLVRAILKHEPEHTWSRYACSIRQKPGTRQDESVVPLVEIQNAINEAFGLFLYTPTNPDSIEAQLYLEWQASHQRIEMGNDA